MDIQLPGMNGITALGQLRVDPATRAIPVIAVTASAMTHDRQKIMAGRLAGCPAQPNPGGGVLPAGPPARRPPPPPRRRTPSPTPPPPTPTRFPPCPPPH